MNDLIVCKEYRSMYTYIRIFILNNIIKLNLKLISDQSLKYLLIFLRNPNVDLHSS